MESSSAAGVVLCDEASHNSIIVMGPDSSGLSREVLAIMNSHAALLKVLSRVGNAMGTAAELMKLSGSAQDSALFAKDRQLVIDALALARDCQERAGGSARPREPKPSKG